MGVRLSIDDYGTGYSSMTYLKDLPVNELKIDRSFIAGLANDPNDLVIVQSAMDLGHRLGLSIIAEGVEDATTLAALKALGIDIAQGFHLGRPMPENVLQRWMADRNPDPNTMSDHSPFDTVESQQPIRGGLSGRA
jgi:EAL domain-containing protein (putative c-di-GMP-specific phosphodiesterase class I)